MSSLDYKQIFAEAKHAAVAAVKDALEKHGDVGTCGFVWVEIPETEHAKAMIVAGLAKKGCGEAFHRGALVFDPGDSPVQSMTVAEAGSNAFASVLKANGVKAHSWSRMD